MDPLFSVADLESASATANLPVKCVGCGITFVRPKNEILKHLKNPKVYPLKYCSRSCCAQHQRGGTSLMSCTQCAKQFRKMANQIKRSKSGNHFCSRSCAATFNNRNKKHGTRRSKLEVWLEEQLASVFPDENIHYNRKDAIQAELDIYFPDRNLAFELNGIFHYEPIYGPEKLATIQSNDQRKFQACLEQGIELCVIDTSWMKYFKPKRGQKVLDIILKVLEQQKQVGNEIRTRENLDHNQDPDAIRDYPQGA